MERPPVVDFHNDRLAVFQVGDACVGGEWQALVCGRHFIHVVAFATGRAVAVELGAVPGRHATFTVALAVRECVVALAAHDIGVRVAVAASGFCPRNCIGNMGDIDQPVRRTVVALAVAAASRCGTG